MKREDILKLAPPAAVLAALGTAVYAQDKYSLTSPSGIAFSDFKGYEDWALVSSARTDEVLKVIVANPAMIDAYKAGVPGNGLPFPEGSKIAKLQWKPKKSTEAPFDVDVPDVFTQAFVIEKDSKKFPKTGGWGYALFNYDALTGKFTADATGHRRLRALMPCGGEEQGLHLPSVPDAVTALDGDHHRAIALETTNRASKSSEFARNYCAFDWSTWSNTDGNGLSGSVVLGSGAFCGFTIIGWPRRRARRCGRAFS